MSRRKRVPTVRKYRVVASRRRDSGELIGESYHVKDGRRMAPQEVQLERWAPRLRVHLKEAFDRNHPWPEALKLARQGCVQENARYRFLTDATADISEILDLLEDEAEADWHRWIKGRKA